MCVDPNTPAVAQYRVRKIEQVDRDRAARYALILGNPLAARYYREGRNDNTPLVLAFADCREGSGYDL